MTTGEDAPPTIYAVAREAGASIASVSRVLSGGGRTSEGLRRRVLEAADRLDYVPSSAARTLAAGAFAAVGLVLGDLRGEYFPALVTGFEAAATAAGSSTLLRIAGNGDEPALAARELLSRVDGLAIGPSALPDDAVARLAARVPVVLVARAPVAGCDAVLAESATSTAMLVEHLVQHGRRRLRVAGDVAGSWDARQRALAFSRACGELGIEAAAPVQAPQTEQGGARLADALAGDVRAGRVDAVVCANDELALALMRRLRALGIAVPQDVAVTGFDDVTAARYVVPGLTTVRQPVFELGREAALALHRRVREPGGSPALVSLPTRFLPRESCGEHPTEETP